MDWMGKKVLVTGGAGQIGSNLVARLTGLGAKVTIADNLWRGSLQNLQGESGPVIDLDRNFHKVDLVDYESCLKVTANQDVVFHLADVVAGINFVFSNEMFVFTNNLIIDSNMIRASTENRAGTYVYVGTACSYPADKQIVGAPPFREEDVYPANPESAYGWSKLMGEFGCDLLRKANAMPVGLLRLHNVYGPHCVLDPAKSQVIPALIRKAIRHPAEEFVVWGSGRQRRAFVFVEDVVDALVSVVERGLDKGAIQIGPDYSTSIAEIAEKVVAVSGRDIPIRFDTTKPEGDADRAADWSKAKEILGWKPKTSIDEGLAKTFAWCERMLKDEASAA